MINNNLRITWARREEIKDIARETLKKYNITTPPAKPKRILKGIGELYGFSNPEEKGFTLYKDNEYFIYINTVEYKFMVTWTYAHELGHIVLDHFHLGYGYLTSEFNCKILDTEADIFAAEFLMQEDWIREYAQLFPPSEAKNLGKLKKIFKVSWDSLLNRLDNLKIQSKNISKNILDPKSNKINESLYSEFIDRSMASEIKSKDIILSDSREFKVTRNDFDIFSRYKEDLDMSNMRVLHSLEEAFLNPDYVSPSFDAYGGWLDYDDEDVW